MNSSSQTLPSQSHSFLAFQSPSSIPLHYSLDSSSKPSSNSKPHQSPLQPLQLNTNSNIPISPIISLQKHQISSPINTNVQQTVAYQSPSVKSNWFASQNSPSIQKQSNHALHDIQVSLKGTNEKKIPSLNKENGMEIEVSEVSGVANNDSYANRENNNNDPNSDKIQEETNNEEEEMEKEDEEERESFNDQQQEENQNLNDSEQTDSISKEVSHKNLLGSPQTERLLAQESLHEAMNTTNDQILNTLLLDQERMNSETPMNNLKESVNESSIEDNNIGISRAHSVGERETKEVLKYQNLSQTTLSNPTEGFRETQLIEQNSLSTNIIKPKKTRQCLNVFCFTNPNDPALWSKQKVMNSAICKACFDAYKRNQHCFFCYQIYLDQETSASNDGKDWIECDGCNQWNHIECEMIHGIKDLNILLQGEENTYKYFCPLCRNDKNAKAASKRLKAFMMTSVPALTKATSNQKQTTIKKQQVRQNKVQPGIPFESKIEEEINIEEKIEEPYGKKVKPNPESNFSVITNFLAKANVKEPVLPLLTSSPLDLTKKKLDSIFIKYQANKKRLPGKVEPIHAFDYHNDIDKLMIIYAGKRVQLSDQEIKADLDLFKEMSKTSTCHSDEKSNESEFGMETLIDMTEEKYKADQIEEFNGLNYTIRRKLSRPKTKDVQYNENSAKDEEEMLVAMNILEQKKTLRNRKRLD